MKELKKEVEGLNKKTAHATAAVLPPRPRAQAPAGAAAAVVAPRPVAMLSPPEPNTGSSPAKKRRADDCTLM